MPVIVYIKESPKPSFLKSGFPIIILIIPMLVCGLGLSTYTGRVTNDKSDMVYYMQKQKDPNRNLGSVLSLADIRKNLTEAKQHCVSSHLEYYNPYGKVVHNGTEGTTIVNFDKKKELPIGYDAGNYHFLNGEFVRFEDGKNKEKKPSEKNIEAAKNIHPKLFLMCS